jgi:hypothetical protein
LNSQALALRFERGRAGAEQIVEFAYLESGEHHVQIEVRAKSSNEVIGRESLVNQDAFMKFYGLGTDGALF